MKSLSKTFIDSTESERSGQMVPIAGPPLPPYPKDWLDLIRSSEETQV